MLPLALSVTFTVKLLDPAVPGVPDIVPPADRVNPAGSVPTDTVHEYGGDPPEAASACEYAVPTVPAGSDDVVILSAGGLIVNDSAAVVETDALSVTFTVKLLDPAVPGVPEIVPPADRLNPAGSVPTDTVHEYGGDPPEAASACEYAVPTVPAGSDAVVILNAGGLIVSDSAAVVETDALSVTFTVKLLDPAVPGVPEIVPPADRLKPAGSVPTDTVHVYGGDPPEAASACEYAVPTVPAGSDAVVIVKAGGLIVSDSAPSLCTDRAVRHLHREVARSRSARRARDRPARRQSQPRRQRSNRHRPVYGGDPPEAASACEYAVPDSASGQRRCRNRQGRIDRQRQRFVVRDNAFVVLPFALSVTFTVKLLDPAVPGVPDIVPPADRLNPAGSVPTDTVHVYGADPPEAASACEYAVPTVPAGSDAVVIVKAGLIVSDSAFVVLPLALSVTFTVKLLDPAVPGVPEIVPPADRLNPAGSVPTDTVHVYGVDPPEAASACEYAVPTVPAGSDAVVIVKAGLIVSDNGFVATPPPLSANRTVKAAVPAAAGVPLMIPVEASQTQTRRQGSH